MRVLIWISEDFVIVRGDDNIFIFSIAMKSVLPTQNMIRVIRILWIRQIKRHIRSRARMISSIVQPMLFLVALGFGFGPIYARAGGGNYIEFLAPGVISMSILFTAVFSGIEIIWDKQFGFLKETLVAPVPRSIIMLGRTLGGATVAMIQGMIVFCFTLFVGFRPEGVMVSLVAIIFAFLTALFFTALGTAIATRIDDLQAFPLVMNFLIMPIFFLSGALFPMNQLPKALTIVTHINPLSYGVDGIRGALTGVAHFSYSLDAVVLIGGSIVLLFLGGWLFSKIEA